MRKILILAAAILLLASCQSDVTGVNIPEPGSVAGAWSGSGSWDALQGGAPAAVTAGAATAAMFQSGASILGGSTWQVTGVFSATLTGTIDDEGNISGTTSLTVPCPATASFGGSLSADGSQLSIAVSFSDPGTTPCAGAPIGLVLSLSR